MALQGTIDTFDLTEVIRMLAVGEKTGRLGLSGDRGSGSIWFADGHMVASDTDSTPLAVDHAAVLFQLLRFREGSFIFDQGAKAPDPGPAVDSEPVIEEALRRSEEWVEIEAVVPSLDHRVVMAAELGRSDVVIDQSRWRVLSMVAGGSTVGAVGEMLDLGELDVSRTIKDLVELTLIEVQEPVDAPVDEDGPAAAEATGHRDEPEDVGIEAFGGALAVGADHGGQDTAGEHDEDDEDDEAIGEDAFDTDWLTADADPGPAADHEPAADNAARDQLDALASGFGLTDESFPVEPVAAPVADEPIDIPGEPLDFGEPEPLAGAIEDGAGSFPIEEAEAAGEARTPLFAHDAESVPDAHVPAPGDAAEVARQLANLSPEATRAVAAAARATTVEEREAALALVAEDGDEPLDPDLLRSFLSSVRN